MKYPSLEKCKAIYTREVVKTSKRIKVRNDRLMSAAEKAWQDFSFDYSNDKEIPYKVDCFLHGFLQGTSYIRLRRYFSRKKS